MTRKTNEMTEKTGTLMTIAQLKAGYRVCEHLDCGAVRHYDVLKVAPAGRRVEVTFATTCGADSVSYPADAFLYAHA